MKFKRIITYKTNYKVVEAGPAEAEVCVFILNFSTSFMSHKLVCFFKTEYPPCLSHYRTVLWTDELFEVSWSSVPSNHDHLYQENIYIFPATFVFLIVFCKIPTFYLTFYYKQVQRYSWISNSKTVSS